MLLTTCHTRRARMAPIMAALGLKLAEPSSVPEARESLARGDALMLLVDADLPRGEAFEIVADLHTAHPEVAVVVLSDDCGVETAMRAMQSGACDLIPSTIALDIAVARLRPQILRAEKMHARRQAMNAKIDKLKSLCRQLNSARHEVTRHVGSLCTNLTGAYREMADQLEMVGLASEFNSLIRQELDVESLLRTALEYMLTKTGPTNAAVFLPATSGDFSLGAYVNYDCAKDTAEVLLDHLAAALAPKFESEREVVFMNARGELEARIGEAADWLRESSVVTMACRVDGECLAVLTLFRDRSTPFSESLKPVLKTMGDLFGKQLSRIIHVHHRHLPKSKWGAPGDPCDPPERNDDDIDLAA
jgi:FixJ family two-component response regulator